MKLIKTAIELKDSGNSDDIMLLGDWCLAGADTSLTKPKIIAVPYHWDDRKKYYSDYSNLTNIYEELLASLVPILNYIHNIDRDIRYWRIIVGPWLRFFIDSVFDRYECIKAAKESKLDLDYRLYSYNLTDWCPMNFLEFWGHLTSDQWNEIIFSECIKMQKITHTESKEYILPVDNIKEKTFLGTSLLKAGLKLLSSKYSEIIGPFYKGSILLGTYVPARKLFKLYSRLSQIPFFLLPVMKINSSEINYELRASLKITPITNDFEGLIKNLLPVLMPKVYLENFSELRMKILAKCPAKPKSIFTANSYQADDVFKIWAAEKVNDGVPLILGQHGGTFAIARHNQTVDHQFLIAEKFVTWGWSESTDDNTVKLPSMQLSGKKKIVPDKEGNILLIETTLPRYFYCHYAIPIAGQFLHYLRDQLEFISGLEPASLKHLSIRLDRTLPSRSWDVLGVFNEAGYSNHVDKSKQTLIEAIKKSRVCVCTSNSTVFLETLSMNFPTIVFWDADYNEISIEAQPYIDILVKAEILFLSATQAVNHINKIAFNINEWWFSPEVQLAREIFCDCYALTSPDWLNEWRNFLSGN